MKLAAAVATALLASSLPAQSLPGAYRAVFTYDRPGLSIPHWQIAIPEQGQAQYTGIFAQGADPGKILFTVSDAGRSKLGELLDASHNLKPCETKTRGIANMGAKDVTYAPNGLPEAHCAFNYTDNRSLSDAADYVIAIANTVEYGLELDRLHRYDRLGLDAEVGRLVTDVKDGRAVEIVAIQPALQRIVEDEALMERVRSRAQQLLEVAKLPTGR